MINSNSWPCLYETVGFIRDMSKNYEEGPKIWSGYYLPTSLTCLCKVMGHIVLSHVAKHLSSNNILIDSQHGFREKLSTVTQLITSCHDWASTLQKRGQADVVLLDFSKAFDKLPHQYLSAKLSFYGIQDPTLDWSNSWSPMIFDGTTTATRSRRRPTALWDYYAALYPPAHEMSREKAYQALVRPQLEYA